MSDFRKLAVLKKATSLNDLHKLLDELASAEEFGATLILSALKDKDPKVRSYAARKLGLSGLGRPDIVHGLVEALNDEYTSVRQYASAALGVLEPLPVSAITAIKKAMDDVDPTVREFSTSNYRLIERQLDAQSMAS